MTRSGPLWLLVSLAAFSALGCDPPSTEIPVDNGSETTATVRWIAPADTDPAIDDWLEPHFVALDAAVPSRGRLLVFFPGSGALPSQYTEFVRFAAGLGFHAIGLRYPNSWSVNFDLCGFSTDADCHERVRSEILDGGDSSALIQVGPANCIINRLVKLLLHLDHQYPGEGWGQYLAAGLPRWNRIVTAGHSQGGGHAAFIAKRYSVARVVMLAGGTDLFFGWPRRYAPWLSGHTTPAARYYGLVHEQDSADAYLGAWEILGLPEFGPPRNTEETPPPYLMTHQLTTGLPPPNPAAQGAYHNAVAADAFLTRDEQGRPRLSSAWEYLLITPAPGEAERVSGPGVHLIDPEVLSEQEAIVSQDGGGNAWFARIDPRTGRFRYGDGREQLIDFGLPTPLISYNGPEFGCDAAGWAVFYTKSVSGIPQTWRATLGETGFTTVPLTSGPPHLAALASRNPAAPHTRLLVLRGSWENGGMLSWLDESDPQTEHDIEFVVGRASTLHWVHGSNDFVVSWRGGPAAGQVARYDAAADRLITITNDAGFKSNPWGWHAPEFGGALLVLAVIDDAALGIYRDTGGPYWTRIATLTPPVGATYPVVASPEPFVANGRSYISLTLKAAAAGPQPGEIWIFGMDDAPATRFARRCDDGEPGVTRFDPEWLIGRTQVFVYYNRLAANGTVETWTCPTGIPVGPPGDCDYDGVVTADDALGLAACLHGPQAAVPAPCNCRDIDADQDVDLVDLARVQAALRDAGPRRAPRHADAAARGRRRYFSGRTNGW